MWVQKKVNRQGTGRSPRERERVGLGLEMGNAAGQNRGCHNTGSGRVKKGSGSVWEQEEEQEQQEEELVLK